MFEQLKKQYDLLTEEEKNIVLIYQSKLSYFINRIDYIMNSKQALYDFKKQYEAYKKVVLEPENIFVQNTIFKDINFRCFDQFIQSVWKVRRKLNDLKGKIILPEDVIVYRATTVKSENEIKDISKGNFISTTLDIEVTDDFYSYDGINVLYQIKLSKGTPCLVVPYSVEATYLEDKTLLKIVNHNYQSEIILFKDSFDYIVEDQQWIDEENITVQKISTTLINKKK